MAELPNRDNERLPIVLPPTGSAMILFPYTKEAEEDFLKTLPPVLVQSRLAFRRDLSRLMGECPGQWVAYQGDSLIAGPERTKHDLFLQCQRLGAKPGEYLLLMVIPESAAFIRECEILSPPPSELES